MKKYKITYICNDNVVDISKKSSDDDIDEYVSEETYNSWMHRGFGEPGDVLIVTEGHTFGNVCRIPKDLTKFALGQRVITIRGINNLINNVYLSSYMQLDD